MAQKLSFAENFALSGCAAVISKTAAAPIERIKLLIQNQDEMIKQVWIIFISHKLWLTKRPTTLWPRVYGHLFREPFRTVRNWPKTDMVWLLKAFIGQRNPSLGEIQWFSDFIGRRSLPLSPVNPRSPYLTGVGGPLIPEITESPLPLFFSRQFEHLVVCLDIMIISTRVSKIDKRNI